MRKLILTVTVILSLNVFNVKADEGVWLPLLIDRLNYVDMQKMGLNLTAEEIYSVNHSSLKDAIVSLNNGSCTGEIISAEGLLLTNHHCAYNYIQNHSTVDKDYLTTGFWSTDKIEELRNDKLSAAFLIRIEDVSGKSLPYLNDNMTEKERNAKIEKAIEKIEKEAIDGNHYNANVKEFFKGGEFYLFVYEVFGDVRLVGAPPSYIGKFGGESRLANPCLICFPPII